MHKLLNLAILALLALVVSFLFMTWQSRSPFAAFGEGGKPTGTSLPRPMETAEAETASSRPQSKGWWMLQFPNGQHKEMNQLFDDLDAYEQGE